MERPIELNMRPLPECIDPVFVKTSRKRSFSMTENERLGLVFAKTGSINSGTSLADVHLCTFDSTTAGFTSFPVR
jgi:hypothetical protein